MVRNCGVGLDTRRGRLRRWLRHRRRHRLGEIEDIGRLIRDGFGHRVRIVGHRARLGFEARTAARGGAARRRRSAVEAGRRGLRAAFGGSAARGAILLASSSAMMRRMEARISSIDGSCDFAGCVMPDPSPASCSSATTCLLHRAHRQSSPPRPATHGAAANHATATMQRSGRVCHGESRRQGANCGHAIRREIGGSRPIEPVYLPSGVRTPIQASRTC